MPLSSWTSSSWLLLAVALLCLCCRQGRALYTYSCDGFVMRLSCGPGTVLQIRSGLFGKMPGTLNRCGETTRIHRGCQHDITEFMKYKCEGIGFCQVHVELATFALERFCPDFIKYAEVYFDCVPPAVATNARNCINKCLPPPVRSHNSYGRHATSHVRTFSGNAVVPNMQYAPDNSRQGVVYSHQGGQALYGQSPQSPPPSWAPSGGGGGGGGGGPGASPKGFGSAPAHPAPSPGHSGHPGHPGPSPGHAGHPSPSPGHHGPSPGHPGHPGPSPGHSGHPGPSPGHPGHPGSSPGHHGPSPGHPGPSPGHPGHPGPSPGHHGPSPGHSGHHGPSPGHPGHPAPSPGHGGGATGAAGSAASAMSSRHQLMAKLGAMMGTVRRRAHG